MPSFFMTVLHFPVDASEQAPLNLSAAAAHWGRDSSVVPRVLLAVRAGKSSPYDTRKPIDGIESIPGGVKPARRRGEKPRKKRPSSLRSGGSL